MVGCFPRAHYEPRWLGFISISTIGIAGANATPDRTTGRFVMKLLRSATSALLLTVALATPSGGDTLTPAKRADIEHLLQITNSLAIGQQFSVAMVGQLVNTVKAAKPDVSPQALESLAPAVNGVIADSLGTFKNILVGIYSKYFTHDDIKQMTAFYSTPLGKKMISVMPSLLQESMQAGQKWGEGLGPEIYRRVRAQLAKQGVKL